jgi:hypothetical protein
MDKAWKQPAIATAVRGRARQRDSVGVVRTLLIGIAGVCAIAGTSRGQPAVPARPPAPSPLGPAPPTPTPPTPASPAPAPPASAPPAADPAAPAAPLPPDPDPAWSAYDDAFSHAAAGDVPGANARLTELAKQWPLHPAAAHATLLVRAREPRPRDPDAPSNVARGELVFWSTVGGVFTAANVCVIVDCKSDRETAAVYTLGVGGSLALALAASRHGVAQGEAQLYNSAQTWGSWNGLAINNDFAQDTGQAAVALGAQGAGLLAGIGLWKTWHPSQGDVALTNSFLLWSTVLTVWGHLAADTTPTLRRVVVAGDVGIVLGALTSTQVKMSRGRTLLLDVGGGLGILGGGLVALGTRSESGVGASLLAGTVAGLGLAALATHDWDAPQVTLTPARITSASGTSVWGVTAAFGF